MTINQNDIDKAIQFAETVKMTASLDPNDGKTIDFHMSKEIPEDLDDEVKQLLEIAVQYYQRSIFTGEYVMEDDFPPTRRSGEPIDDINFYLSYYKTKLIEELKKAYDLDDDLKIKPPEIEGPKLTPYAQVMLEYRKKMMKKKKS